MVVSTTLIVKARSDIFNDDDDIPHALVKHDKSGHIYMLSDRKIHCYFYMDVMVLVLATIEMMRLGSRS